jgi:hypothetical protein
MPGTPGFPGSAANCVDFTQLGALQIRINVAEPTGQLSEALDFVLASITTGGIIGDRVWKDRNGNGQQDCTDSNGDGILGNSGDTGPECNAGIPDVPVSLYPSTGGVCNTAATPVGSVVTDANGFYLFEGLDPGDYCVRFTRPADYCGAGIDPEFTRANVGSDISDSDADPVTGNTGTINLVGGEIERTWDAGLYCPAALGDYLWNDVNKNGIQDEPASAGINGQNVFLLDCASPPQDCGHHHHRQRYRRQPRILSVRRPEPRLLRGRVHQAGGHRVHR